MQAKSNGRLAAFAAAIAATVAVVGVSVAGADHIANVGTHNIKNNSIRSQDVRDGAIQTQDLRPSTVQELQGNDGADGADGQDGVSGYEVVTETATWTPGSGTNSTLATCSEGNVPLGGGYDTQQDNDGNSHLILGSKPQDSGSGSVDSWRVFGKAAETHAEPDVVVFAICAAVTPAS